MRKKKRPDIFHGIVFYGASELLCLFLCRLYVLPLSWTIFMGAVLLVFLPLWRANRARAVLEDNRLTDAQVYMEQILYAFMRQKKLLTSLEEVSILFPDGNMHRTIQGALRVIRYDYEEEDVMERSLKKIEAEYESDRLHTIHTFLYKVEKIGGECDGIMTLLLKDLNGWRKRMDIYRQDCKKARHNVAIAIFVSLFVCVTANFILPSKIDVSGSGIRIGSTVIFMVTLLLIYTRTDKKLAVDWLRGKDNGKTCGLADKYRSYTAYDEKRERKRSVCYSLVPSALTVFFLIKKSFFAAGIAACVSAVFFCQHKIGHALAKKNLSREIEKAFPKWLMELSLLLQIENVQVSIVKTLRTAPEVLKPALEDFQKKITASPEEALPYLEFLKEFSLPQIQSAMKMLFAISMGNGGNEQEQTAELVERNMNLMERAEALKNEDALAGMYLLFLAPALVGAIKLIIDMTVFLLAFFVQAGSL